MQIFSNQSLSKAEKKNKKKFTTLLLTLKKMCKFSYMFKS